MNPSELTTASKHLPLVLDSLCETSMTQSRNAAKQTVPLVQQLFVFLVAAVVIALDQFSKAIVEARMPLNTTYAPIPSLEAFFRITHVSNTGAAFGLFAQGSMVFTIVAIVVSLVIVFYSFSLPPGLLPLRLALGLQMGGALGNLIDRFRLGHVTDFLDFGPWPVFNVADTSIVAGVAILAVLMLLEQRREAVANAAARQDEPQGEPPEGGERDLSAMVLPSSGYEEVNGRES